MRVFDVLYVESGMKNMNQRIKLNAFEVDRINEIFRCDAGFVGVEFSWQRSTKF